MTTDKSQVAYHRILGVVANGSRADRHEVLEALLAAGAPGNAHGINDWTPAHMAAVREDIEALRILIKHGADLTIRTRIDDYATVLEEAQILERTKSVEYLLRLGKQP
jgi:ankyrin repeat protein